MRSIRTIEPVDTPISVTEAKQYCRVETNDDDGLIADLIAAATSMIEDYLGRALMPQTWQVGLDRFEREVLLSRGPVTEVTAFQYVDIDGAEQSVPEATYEVDLISDPQRVLLARGASWPSAKATTNAVKITYASGHAALPGSIRQAVKMLVLNWYDNRSAVLSGTITVEMPLGVMALLQNQRAFV